MNTSTTPRPSRPAPTAATTPGEQLRAMMDAGTVAAPGAFNALVGLAIRDAGFGACYVSGGATTVAAGVPDIGVLALPDFVRLIREIHAATGLPILADADTGFGEEEMIRRTVADYAHAGAAGLHIEDQVFPKRCGHLDGKVCVSTEQMVENIRWAREAADAAGSGFVVCARTDARHVEGFEQAVERSRAYLDAGADMLFPEGLASEEEFERFTEGVRAGRSERVYLLANMTEFGKTPSLSLDRFSELGYDMVIYPVSMLRVAMGAVSRALADLKQTGTLDGQLAGMQPRDELYRLVGYRPGTPWKFPVVPGAER